ncbi:Glycosyl hydrolases family 16 [Modestobacter sp. DSM 44400]|uniref:glycoside hydrolase family 16 protein n=1 Tax=Modestobacter sp. DSM 44400 TaxID=1550230 RepID=UPI00089B92F7|nr:glycoside hydrolase family 16 protein [Modestobacter sp. DSM 44400]SDY54378.1 Glycosyl hydrolases family 16 [Modestobacter sp. DSM 44400]
MTTGGWLLAWHDDFDGPAGSFPDPSVWTAELGGGGWGNRELQTYTDARENVALDGDGHLVICARATTTESGDVLWTSARITTSGKRTSGHGLYEVRARVPSGVGIWPAAWTLGEDIDQLGWPTCGEIDLIESVGDATTALQTVHGGHRDATHWQLGVTTAVERPLCESFHTYSAQWFPDRVVFGIDGLTTGVVSARDATGDDVWPFPGQQYLLLNVAVGGTLPGPPDASTPPVTSLVVDWVRCSVQA